MCKKNLIFPQWQKNRLCRRAISQPLTGSNMRGGEDVSFSDYRVQTEGPKGWKLICKEK
jgi:hypothetical protein